MTPHVPRHYCASSLYAAAMDIKALQELLGHQWLATTSGYIRVRTEHIELCTVLDCTPNDLMTPEPDKVIARRPRSSEAANGNDEGGNGDGNGSSPARPVVTPRLGKPRSQPPL